jgi:hypothetical protein
MDNQINQDFTQSVTLSSTWTRYSVTGTFNSTSGTLTLGVKLTAGSATSVDVAQFQVSDSASLDTYVANNFAAPSAAAYYGPRLDYDPSTLAAKGLLVEEQRTNLVLQSNAFDNAAWFKSNVTVTANQVASPDGSVNAYKLDFAAVSNPNIQPTTAITVTNGAAYTFSFYARAVATVSNVKVSIYGSDTSVTIGTSWQRFTVSFTATSTTVSPVLVTRDSVAATIYLYGAQLEAGSFATSYIPTTSATVTRSADVAQVSTQAFPYSQTEGTATGAATRAITIASDGTSANRIYLNVSTTGVPNYLVVSSTATQASINATEITSNSINRFAAAYKTDDFASCLNGGTVGTDTLGSSPTGVFRLDLGNFVGGNQINGHIRQITYIPRRLTNAELQQRSS